MAAAPGTPDLTGGGTVLFGHRIPHLLEDVAAVAEVPRPLSDALQLVGRQCAASRHTARRCFFRALEAGLRTSGPGPPHKSEALAAAHEAALGLAEAGLMSKRTMRAFDEMCLTPVEEMAPEDIRALRLRENASQAVFARYLNVTTGLVSQWERGEKRPRGASLKLLTLVAKNGLGAVA